jgi:hypothetical protein
MHAATSASGGDGQLMTFSLDQVSDYSLTSMWQQAKARTK